MTRETNKQRASPKTVSSGVQLIQGTNSSQDTSAPVKMPLLSAQAMQLLSAAAVALHASKSGCHATIAAVSGPSFREPFRLGLSAAKVLVVQLPETVPKEPDQTQNHNQGTNHRGTKPPTPLAFRVCRVVFRASFGDEYVTLVGSSAILCARLPSCLLISLCVLLTGSSACPF